MIAFKQVLLVFAVITATMASQRADAQAPALKMREAYDRCTTADMDWVNFCNGLIQGYADAAIFIGEVCIPEGTTRTDLVGMFTGPWIKYQDAYKYDLPAFFGAMEVLKKKYPC